MIYFSREKTKGEKTMDFIGGIIFLSIILSMVIGYCYNVIYLVDCDFKAPYKAEILRTVGVVSPLGAIFGWMDIKD